MRLSLATMMLLCKEDDKAHKAVNEWFDTSPLMSGPMCVAAYWKKRTGTYDVLLVWDDGMR